jgi:hypothetical protein
MNILTHTFEQAINSKTHREHRLMLSRNEKPVKCTSCYDSEEATGKPTSKRQRVIRMTAPHISEYATVDTAASLTAADGSIKQNIVNLDLRFGNLCNQKCIMCGPEYSSAWYSDWLDIKPHNKFYPSDFKSYEILKDDHGRAYSNFSNWWESDIWWTKFDEIAHQIRYIYFTGGEPFLVPAMQEILDRLIAKVIDRLKKFKRIILCVSIDDTEDRYELIRFPGNYKKFLNNIELLKSKQIEIQFLTTCIGIATPYTVLRVDKLAKELGINRKYRFLEGPLWLDIRQYPKNAKLEIIEKYQEAMKEPGDHTWTNAVVNLLTKYLDQSDDVHLQEFIRVMNILDRNRGTNWKSTLDDVYDLLTRHAPQLDFQKIDNFKYGPN